VFSAATRVDAFEGLTENARREATLATLRQFLINGFRRNRIGMRPKKILTEAPIGKSDLSRQAVGR